MLNVNRLRILKEVAYRSSFSAAADALSYTQSAVSQQIAALEAETGMTLIERRTRGVGLTAAGQTLLGHAEGILAGVEAAEDALDSIAGLRGGRLRMASFPTAGATLMPLAIATFRERHPAVELNLAEGEPEEVVPRLRAGELDLALLFEFEEPAGEPASVTDSAAFARVRAGSQKDGRAGREANRKTGGQTSGRAGGRADLRRVHLLEDPMYLALPREHRLAGRKRLRLEDLSGEAWVQTSKESPCARHVVRSCHAAGFEPNVAFESDDYQTVQGLVAAGVGVALIPELALSVVREDVLVKALSPRPPVRQVIAATAAGARLLPAAPAMLTVLEEVAAGYRGLGESRTAA
ncbi:MAG TPA: LysR substrate-binding domain-containing protein [Solirubrobacteraceae bacterium]|nr:LysR substrate-binding domain-containing protein [Solirubrobacteraceae bacterium]